MEPFQKERIQSAEDDSLIRGLLAVVKARGMIFKIVFLGSLASVLVAYILPRKYQSSSSFVSQQRSGASAGLGMASSAASLVQLSSAFGLSGSGSATALYLFFLKSRTVQDLVITKLNLTQHYGVKDVPSARGILAKASYSKIDDGDTIRITIEDKSAEYSAKIADEYVSALNHMLNQMTLSEAEKHAEFLEGRNKLAIEELSSAEKALTDYQVLKGVFYPESELEAGGKLRQKLEDLLVSEQLKLSQLSRSETLASPRVGEIQSNISDLKNQLKNLTSSSPNIRKVNRSLTSANPEIVSKLISLKRDLEIKESIYELLTKELELAKASAAKERLSVIFVDHAETPTSAFFPSKKLFLLVGFALSFVIGVLLAIWGEGLRKLAFRYQNLESIQALKRELKGLMGGYRRGSRKS